MPDEDSFHDELRRRAFSRDATEDDVRALQDYVAASSEPQLAPDEPEPDRPAPRRALTVVVLVLVVLTLVAIGAGVSALRHPSSTSVAPTPRPSATPSPLPTISATPEALAIDVLGPHLPMLDVFERPQTDHDRLGLTLRRIDPASSRYLAESDGARLMAAKQRNGAVCIVIVTSDETATWTCSKVARMTVSGLLVQSVINRVSFRAEWTPDGRAAVATAP